MHQTTKTVQKFVAVAVLVTIAGSSGCRKKTDEQRLRAKIDCTTVHLYVATKVALTGDPTNADVQNTRRLLFTAAQTSMRLFAATEHALNRTAGATPTQAVAPTETLHPQDIATLAVALWRLRAEGARLVRTGDDDRIPSVILAIATIASLTLAPELRSMLNPSAEHALFFMVLLAMRFDSRVPIPVPPELLLYEADRTHAEQTGLLGLEGLLHAAKAYVYGTNDFCDLAKVETRAVDAAQMDPLLAASTLRTLSNNRVSLQRSEALSMNASARVLAHGSIAMCAAKQGDTRQTINELGSVLDALNDLGISSDETATLRAFVAYEQGNTTGARAALAQARQSTTIDATTRNQIAALDAAIAANDRRAVRHVMNDAAIAQILARILYCRLERSGALAAFRQTPIFQQVDGYLRTASRTVSQASTTLHLPSNPLRR